MTELAAHETHYQVQLPTLADARMMLARASGVAVGNLPQEANGIVAECGLLPLALSLCGGMVRRKRRWSDLLQKLREHDLKYASANHPLERLCTIFR